MLPLPGGPARFPRPVVFGCLVLLSAAGPAAAAGAAAPYADTLSVGQVALLFPKNARPNVRANWPVVRRELELHQVGDSKAIVLYALATIRAETPGFSPAPERPNRFSKKRDRVTYAGVSDAGAERPFGGYDSTIRFDSHGKPIVNKRLGNCYYRGKDDALMRARHGDPPLPPCDDGERYRGRGFIQLTGRYNYEQMQRQLAGEPGVDLVNHPEAAGSVGVAAKVLAAFLASSHAERRALNALARRELVKRGVVAAGGVSVEIAVGKGVTSAERTDPRHYEEGDVVTYDRAAPSHRFMAGDSARVVGVDAEKHTVTVKRLRDGATVEYDPRRLRGGDLARVESRELAAGDRVQFRRADRTRSIANGATATVRETAPGRLVLELDGPPGGKGRTVTIEAGGAPLPLDHAYAVTSHASQGSTVRRVLATFDTRHSAELVNRQQANVTLSRASHELTVYTDDRGRLPRAVDRQATKTSALDVRKPARRDHHADAPLSRDPSPASWRADALPRAEQSDRDGQRQPGGRPGPAGGGAPDRPGRSAELAATPGSGAGARPGSRADRAQRPRDPLPLPGGERTAGEEPRPRGAAHGDGGPGGAAERGSAVRLGGGALDAGDARRGLPAGDGARSAAAHPPPTLIVRLVAAAERWYGAEAGRGAAGKAAGAGGEKAAGARPERGRAGEAGMRTERHKDGRIQEARPRSRGAAGRGGRQGSGSASLGSGEPAGVAPWRPARAAPAPLHHLLHPRAAGAALSALHRLGDAERQLVQLVKRIGPARALALLPAMLARAVRGLRAVARLLAGPERGR